MAGLMRLVSISRCLCDGYYPVIAWLFFVEGLITAKNLSDQFSLLNQSESRIAAGMYCSDT